MVSATLYGASDCPVCGDALFFAKDILTHCLFFFCPLCGCAWSSPPAEGVVESLTPAKVFAPSGIELPTRTEIEAAGLQHLIVKDIHYAALPEYLVEYIRGASTD